MAACSGKTSDGFRCGNPVLFVVYLESADAQVTCGKHLAQLVTTRLHSGDVRFVKVADLHVAVQRGGFSYGEEGGR